MTAHGLSGTDEKMLITRPTIFQPDNAMDPDLFSVFKVSWSSCRKYLEEEEKKAKYLATSYKCIEQVGHPFYHIPDKKKCGNVVCAGCRRMMIFCHYIVYDLFCVYKVIK